MKVGPGGGKGKGKGKKRRKKKKKQLSPEEEAALNEDRRVRFELMMVEERITRVQARHKVCYHHPPQCLPTTPCTRPHGV